MPYSLLNTSNLGIVWATVALLLCAGVVSWLRNLDIKWRSAGYAKLDWTLFDPFGYPRAVGPRLLWLEKTTLYEGNPTRSISIVPLLWGKAYFLSSSKEVFRHVTGEKTMFEKADLAMFSASSDDHVNLMTASRHQWRRYRVIMKGAFDEAVYEMLWSQCILTYREMIGSLPINGRQSVLVPNLYLLTRKFTLLILASAGLGVPLRDPGEQSLRQDFDTVTEDTDSTSAPSNLIKGANQQQLGSRARIVSRMKKLVSAHRLSSGIDETQRPNVFSSFLKANAKEKAATQLDEMELIDNAYGLLRAGHDPSAKIMGATLALHAASPREQDALYRHIQEVLAGGRDPTVADFKKTFGVQACVLEAMRLFPATPFVVRSALANTTVRLQNGQVVIIEAGTKVICDIVGMNYNPEYYEKPTTFMPARWVNFERKVLPCFGFGLGPRTCIGRKFALLEITCFLTMLLRDWKVEPDLNQGESFVQWYSRVFSVSTGMTMGLSRIPISLERSLGCKRYKVVTSLALLRKGPKTPSKIASLRQVFPDDLRDFRIDSREDLQSFILHI